MSDDMNGYSKLLIGGVMGITKLILGIPKVALIHTPSLLVDALRLGKYGEKIADRIGFGNDKITAEALSSYMNNMFAGKSNVLTNGDLEALREQLISKKNEDKNIAWLVQPAFLETGVMTHGVAYSEQETSFLGEFYNREALAANCYKQTRGDAMAFGLTSSALMGVLLGTAIFSLVPHASTVSIDAWSSDVVSSALTLKQLIINGVGLALAGLVAVSPFKYCKKIAAFAHDLLAEKTMVETVQWLTYSSGLLDKSTDNKSLNGYLRKEISNFLSRKKAMIKNYEYLKSKNTPIFRVGISDGTARANGSLMGLEKGTVMYQTMQDLFQNVGVYGRIGVGKTNAIAIPRFEEKFKVFSEYGIPFQGLGGDAKATLYIPLMKKLEENNYPTDAVSVIGVLDGQFGIPIFHGKTPDENLAALLSLQSQDGGSSEDDYFTKASRFMASKCLRFAYAFSKTEAAKRFSQKTGGINPYSPYFCNEIGSRPDFLFEMVDEFLQELSDPANEKRATALWTMDVEMAVGYFFNQWKGVMRAPEQLQGVIGSIEQIFNIYLDNGVIAEKFGQGRTGPGYLNPSDCLNGKFFFVALSTVEFGASARAILNTCKTDIYSSLARRAIKWEREGLNPQSSPVQMIIDEKQADITKDTGGSGLDDATAANTARSMGGCFESLTQGRAAYVMKIGEDATANYENQLVTTYYLATNDEGAKSAVQNGSGTVWSQNSRDQDIYSSQPQREEAFGGIMYAPIDYPIFKSKVFGFMSQRLGNVEMFEMVSHRTANRMKTARVQDAEQNNWLSDNNFSKDINEKNAREEIDFESKVVSGESKKIPLFTGENMVDNGDHKGIVRLSLLGSTIWEQFYLEPDYKKALTRKNIELMEEVK